MLFESALMRSALCGVLSVDKRVVLFAVLSGMGEGNLNVLAFQVNDRVEAGGGHGVVEQVYQTVARENALPVI